MRSENVSMYKKLEAEKLYIPSQHTEEMSLVSNQVFSISFLATVWTKAFTKDMEENTSTF